MRSKLNETPSLFIVVIGGRVKSSHIEQHDIRWVVGSCVEDTFSQLRDQWFGIPRGLHIDSFMKVTFIDGFKIIITQNNSKQSIPITKDTPDISYEIDNSLWFVNLGGYLPHKLYEVHDCHLVVAKTSYEAKKIALNRCSLNLEALHKDDLSNVIYDVDNCNCIHYKFIN